MNHDTARGISKSYTFISLVIQWLTFRKYNRDEEKNWTFLFLINAINLRELNHASISIFRYDLCQHEETSVINAWNTYQKLTEDRMIRDQIYTEYLCSFLCISYGRFRALVLSTDLRIKWRFAL